MYWPTTPDLHALNMLGCAAVWVDDAAVPFPVVAMRAEDGTLEIGFVVLFGEMYMPPCLACESLRAEITAEIHRQLERGGRR